MIEAKTAREIAKKFYGMAMMPVEKEQISLRIDALERKARSEGHAERVAAHLIETLTYYPTVAEIVQACEYTPDDAQVLENRKECQWCHGDGFISVDGPYGLSAAYPCDHRGTKNERMGVKVPHGIESHYMRESIEADKAEANWRVNPRNPVVIAEARNQPPPRDKLHRITAEDFEKLRAKAEVKL